MHIATCSFSEFLVAGKCILLCCFAMSGATPESLQKELLGRGIALSAHIKDQSLQDFQKEMAGTGSNVIIRSRLSSLGYDVQTSLSSICQVLALLHLKLVDICEVMVYATLLLALGSMPLRVTAQFFRRQSNISVGKGTKAHQLEMPKRLLDALPGSLKKALESLSNNSFATVTAGIQFLLDRSFDRPLSEKVARHFAEDKGDSAKNSEWERQLKNWGNQSLSALSGEERRKEEHRRSVGEKAARDATTKAVNSGGEFTIMPMVGPKSDLAVSENGLIIGVSPAEMLDIVASLMTSAAASPEDLKSTMSRLRASSIAYGVRATSAYQPILQEEISRQLPLAQKYMGSTPMSSTPAGRPAGGMPETPKPPPPPAAARETALKEAYSDEEMALINEFVAKDEPWVDEHFNILEQDILINVLEVATDMNTALMAYVTFPQIFKVLAPNVSITMAELDKGLQKVWPLSV